jgi:sugar-specific transcriptional regulator TrmB
MEIIDVLRDLGLSHYEADAYLGLLKSGNLTASSIAKEIKIKRTTVYAILKSLASRGLIHVYLKKNKSIYSAVKPSSVYQLYKNKLQSFNEMIPFLEFNAKEEIDQVGLRFIETKEELERFYESILEEYNNSKYRIISSASYWEGIDPEFFVSFRRRRAKNNIKTKLLLSADSKEINPIEPSLLREWRYLPSKYSFKSTIDIYNDKILVIGPKIDGLAVVISIPAMVDIFKSIFDFIWDQSFNNKEK